jgi:hypothetical protein
VNGVRKGALILGILLLLPGACLLSVSAIFVMLAQEYGASETLSIIVSTSPLWLGGFALAGLGVWLIRRERRRQGAVAKGP